MLKWGGDVREVLDDEKMTYLKRFIRAKEKGFRVELNQWWKAGTFKANVQNMIKEEKAREAKRKRYVRLSIACASTGFGLGGDDDDDDDEAKRQRKGDEKASSSKSKN